MKIKGPKYDPCGIPHCTKWLLDDLVSTKRYQQGTNRLQGTNHWTNRLQDQWLYRLTTSITEHHVRRINFFKIKIGLNHFFACWCSRTKSRSCSVSIFVHHLVYRRRIGCQKEEHRLSWEKRVDHGPPFPAISKGSKRPRLVCNLLTVFFALP